MLPPQVRSGSEGGGGLIDRVLQSTFFRDPPLLGMAWGDWCPNLARGPPLGGKACMLGGGLVNSLCIGAQLVGLCIASPPKCMGWAVAVVLPLMGGRPFPPPPSPRPVGVRGEVKCQASSLEPQPIGV